MEDFDIDRELENLIEKYDLDCWYPAYRISGKACALLKEWAQTIRDGQENVLFVSMDEQALHLLCGWAHGERTGGLLIDCAAKLEDYTEKFQSFDKIYIVSFTRTMELLHWFWRHDLQAESVYDILEEQHICLQMEFYRFIPPLVMSDELALNGSMKERSVDGSSLTLYEFYYQKQRLLHCASEEERERIREKLFFLAICMRNFPEAEKILRSLREERYKRCWDEIGALLDRIRNVLHAGKQRHIIIYWLDALSYTEGQKLEYLREKRTHSWYYHNAYTVTPGTNPTCKSIFCGMRQVDDLGYKIRYFQDVPQIGQVEHLGEQNSPLLRDIAREGYDFSILSRYLSRSFEPKYDRDIKSLKETPCSEIFWNLAAQLIQSDRPTVYLAHALTELHAPRLSVRRANFENKYIEETDKEQIEELNAQLAFYDTMLGDAAYRIYMGDHGRFRSNICNSIHVHFQIYHASWSQRESSSLFCYLDLAKILHCLMEGVPLEESVWEREYIPIQEVAFYNPQLVKNVVKDQGLDTLPFYTAYKGAVTEDYLYIHFKTGDEIFHEWKNGEFIPVFWKEDREKRELSKIRRLRKKIGGFPTNLEQDPRFYAAANTYKVYNNIKKTVKKAAGLLNEKLSEYAPGSVVISGEEYHIRWVYALLTEESREKVGGFLAEDGGEHPSKTVSARLPGTRGALPDDMGMILLTARESAEQENRLRKRYEGVDLVDLYRFWKDLGLDFQREFWYGVSSDRRAAMKKMGIEEQETLM